MNGRLVKKYGFEYPVNEYCDVPIYTKVQKHPWEYKRQCVSGLVEECIVCGTTFCDSHGQYGKCMLCIYRELTEEY